MLVGPHKGKKVSEAKPIIKGEMIEAGTACLYFEPESKVMSRTGDECVVAMTDQWYLEYGEQMWKEAVEGHVFSPKFDAYSPESLEKYQQSLNWLKEWACTRQFGLGTKLPWDDQWVIESLSDSTIYMAYYTIAHLLQGEDNLDGSKGSPMGIKPEQLTDDVFNYIFRKSEMPKDSGIEAGLLEKLHDEFRYWYPMNLRVSAKDLIPNHLTMALYNHAAVWDDEPELWPSGYYTNGHVQVDAEKMSKSKGNFLMMDECIEMYSCDGTRFACADAGDSLEDANFSRETAENALMNLYGELQWFGDIQKEKEGMRVGEENYMDKVFSNTMERLIVETDEAFGTMRFRDGIKSGWYEFVNARNVYRDWCQISKVAMRKDLVERWCEALVVMMAPITPHWSEHLWCEVLDKEGFVVKAPFPVSKGEDKMLTRQSEMLFKSLKNFRQQVGKAKKKPTKCAILVIDTYPAWKEEALTWMHANKESMASKEFMKDVKTWVGGLEDKKHAKNIMQFIAFVHKEWKDVGESAMEMTCPFDQVEAFSSVLVYLQTQLMLPEEITVVNLSLEENKAFGDDKARGSCGPSKPVLFTIE